MLVTCSVDKTVTLWDTYNAEKGSNCGPPRACGNKDMGVGKLYTVGFYPSAPWLLGCGGGGKEIALWDMTREASVQKRFGGRTSNANTAPVDDGEQEEAFNAMMTSKSGDEPTESKSSKSKSKKKKSGNKKKKKAHKAGR